MLSRVQLFVTPWTIWPMEFFRPEYWSGWPFPYPGDLPNPGIKPGSVTLRVDSLLRHQGSPYIVMRYWPIVFLVLSFSGVGTKYLISWQELGSVPSSFIFGRTCKGFGAKSSLNIWQNSPVKLLVLGFPLWVVFVGFCGCLKYLAELQQKNGYLCVSTSAYLRGELSIEILYMSTTSCSSVPKELFVYFFPYKGFNHQPLTILSKPSR